MQAGESNEDAGTPLVRFTVSVFPEYDSDLPSSQRITGDLILVFDEREPQIGSIEAYLFDLEAIRDHGVRIFDVYDDREAHSGELAELLFDRYEDVKPAVMRKIGLQPEDVLLWNVHALALRVEPPFRGRGYGNLA